MVVLALLLLAASAAVTVAVLLGNTGPVTLDLFGLSIRGTESGLFLTGAGAMLALLAGLWLLRLALARARRRRARVRSLQHERHQEVGRLEQERARLAEEKAQLEQRLASGGAPSTIDLDRQQRARTER